MLVVKGRNNVSKFEKKIKFKDARTQIEHDKCCNIDVKLDSNETLHNLDLDLNKRNIQFRDINNKKIDIVDKSKIKKIFKEGDIKLLDEFNVDVTKHEKIFKKMKDSFKYKKNTRKLSKDEYKTLKNFFKD